MDWFRNLWALLKRQSPAYAQRRVDKIDHTLAELRAKVRALPPEQQAQAHTALNNALDDRRDR